MKWETTPQFLTDWKALPAEHRRDFRAIIPTFSAACDDYVRTGGRAPWPTSLRVAPLRSAPGIWEMTWHFRRPDGRATFEFVTTDLGPHVRWRRIGDHAVFQQP